MNLRDKDRGAFEIVDFAFSIGVTIAGCCRSVAGYHYDQSAVFSATLCRLGALQSRL
jgi:hypothetical protein